MTEPTNLPTISCCMPTYGRSVETLNEAVQCFLEQDYLGTKELVIYNDYKNVQFAFDHPEVRIVNSSEREPTLGAKYNATVALARHDYICLWDDDDIYLPHRLSYSIANLNNDVFRSGRNYLLKGTSDHLELMSSVFPATICIRKSLYDAIGGFEQGELAVDTGFVQKVDKIFARDANIPIEDIFYIYRWNPGTQYHHSIVSANAGGDNLVHGLIDAQLSANSTGTQTLTPTLYRDYRNLQLKSV